MAKNFQTSFHTLLLSLFVALLYEADTGKSFTVPGFAQRRAKVYTPTKWIADVP